MFWNIKNFLFSTEIYLFSGIHDILLLQQEGSLISRTYGLHTAFLQLVIVTVLRFVLYYFIFLELAFQKLHVLNQLLVYIFKKMILILQLRTEFDRIQQSSFQLILLTNYIMQNVLFLELWASKL